MLILDALSVKRGNLLALNAVSLSLSRGQRLAVVGESGAGKSTLISAILGLIRPSLGKVTWNGQPVAACNPSLVMQEPRAAFNPALSLRQSVLEPVVARRIRLQPHRLERLCEGLELSISLLNRRPFELSIGQVQRVGILRALLTSPPLVLFDEPLSALDARTQKHTANLIEELRQQENFTSVVVTHDLGYAAAHSDEIAVLRSGRIEERSFAKDFIESPKTTYGKALREAAYALGALRRVA